MYNSDTTKVNDKTLTNSSCGVMWLNVKALFKNYHFWLNAGRKMMTLYSGCAFVVDL